VDVAYQQYSQGSGSPDKLPIIDSAARIMESGVSLNSISQVEPQLNRTGVEQEWWAYSADEFTTGQRAQWPVEI
jgi:hypothetical protein